MIDTMNEVLVDSLVETIANMNEEQRDKFAKVFVSKLPELAGQISFSIESNLQDAWRPEDMYKKVEVKDPALRLDPTKKAYIQLTGVNEC
tara:strand:- start:2675 stop:2944 length:270 start_codon:yes stop_codon:yes gene_type:complete